MTNLLPVGSPEDRRIFRQALAGMVWSKQFFHYDIERWLKGDLHSAACNSPPRAQCDMETPEGG